MLLCGCLPPASSTASLPPPSFPPVPAVGHVGVTELPVWPQVYEASNGLRTVWESSPSNGLVAVITTVDAGSVQDPRGKEGLAHFVEHQRS